MPATHPPKGTLGTVRNASLLLDLLSQGPAFQQLSDLTDRSGLSMPTVHRLLRSLVAAGLVEQDPASSRYGLGPELVRLAESYLQRQPLLQQLMPYVVDLRNRTRATVLVALLIEDHVVYVERIDGADRALLRRTGRSFPAMSTAAGQLLAGRAGTAAWKRLTDAQDGPSLVDLEGWSRADHRIAPVDGVRDHLEVAVPILRPDGSAAAALAATGGPPSFAAQTLVEAVLPELEQTAALLGRMATHGW